MARKKKTNKEVSSSIRSEDRRPPNYLPWKPEFSCPLSPSILWFHGLRYTSCPLVEDERDMDECSSCPCRADNTDELILLRKTRDQEERKKRKKKRSGDSQKAGKRSEPVVTKKGETYVSP